MGRYKQTSVSLKFRRKWRKNVHSSPTEILIDRPKQRLEETLTSFDKSIVKGILKSVKKRGLYPRLVTYFSINEKSRRNGWTNANEPIFEIGNDVRKIISYNCPSNTILPKMRFASQILRLSNKGLFHKQPTNFEKVIPRIFEEEVVKYYGQDEIEAKGIKVYQNPFTYSMVCGTIFAIIGLISILVLLYQFFGISVSLFYALFVSFILSKSIRELINIF